MLFFLIGGGADRDEVSLQNIQTSSAVKKRGYAKIKLYCSQAIKDELKYAWIDTCCINKLAASNFLSQSIPCTDDIRMQPYTMCT
jgi:hypothetical protein